MKFLEQTFAEPAANLAFDEALLEMAEADPESTECLRIWEPESHFVVLGHSNRIASHADIPACEVRAIPILRRISGGGTVLQGPGCLNYSLILRNDPRRNILDTFRYVLKAHCRVIKELSGKTVCLEGTSDLTFDSRKFSGNAQYRKTRFVLVHGTFLLNFDLALIEQLLPVPAEQPAYRSNRSHRLFVTNLEVGSEQLVGALKRAWDAHDPIIKVSTARIEELIRDRYTRRGWSEKF